MEVSELNKLKATTKYIVSLICLTAWLVSCTSEITPEESCNFVQNSQGQRVSWNTEKLITVGVEANIADEEYLRAIESSLQIWEESLGYQVFDYLGVVSDELAGELDIRIFWEYDWDDNNSREQAKTLIKWRGDTIYSATIGVNEEHHNFFIDSPERRKVDLVALMVHEVGHALGLAHTHEHSVMQPELSTNYDGRRFPTENDFSAISCEY